MTSNGRQRTDRIAAASADGSERKLPVAEEIRNRAMATAIANSNPIIANGAESENLLTIYAFSTVFTAGRLIEHLSGLILIVIGYRASP